MKTSALFLALCSLSLCIISLPSETLAGHSDLAEERHSMFDKDHELRGLRTHGMDANDEDNEDDDYSKEQSTNMYASILPPSTSGNHFPESEDDIIRKSLDQDHDYQVKDYFSEVDRKTDDTAHLKSSSPAESITDKDMIVEEVHHGEEGNLEKNDEELPTSSHSSKSSNKNSQNRDARPNIILIMTDDQDIELGSMDFMPETLKIFRDSGMEFRHCYVSTPMCCPSRSSFLTGLYVHNHEVYTNNDNCSSVQWREKHEKRTFAAHLWSSGYYTSYIGKYLNKYDGSHIPYGWNEWNGLLMNSRFYNYTVNKNGQRTRHGNKYEEDYYPDLIANDTLDFLRRVGGNDERGSTTPFLLVASFPSPHGPEDSAPQFSNMFTNSTPHHTPSYNHAPNLDKQWILRNTDEMTPILKKFTNLLMTKRLQSLQSVDYAVKMIFDKLKETGLDKNTYVFYTSDHGYHVGQFGLVKGKSMPYEFDIRVPFFLYGPETVVIKGSRILEPVLNIDLAPTFLDLANIPIPAEMDGRSLVPLIKRYAPGNNASASSFIWKDVFLIESSGRREVPIPATGAPMTSSLKKSKKHREERRKVNFEDNETLRINSLCSLHPHPCVQGQKKYCRKDKERVNFRKCRPFDFIEQSDYTTLFSNDPLYQVSPNGSIEASQSMKKCRCRIRRSSTDLESESDTDTFDWDLERKRIDAEIEVLKQRIEELKHRRKKIRRLWLSNHSESRHNGHKRRKGKSENDSFPSTVETSKDSGSFGPNVNETLGLVDRHNPKRKHHKDELTEDNDGQEEQTSTETYDEGEESDNEDEGGGGLEEDDHLKFETSLATHKETLSTVTVPLVEKSSGDDDELKVSNPKTPLTTTYEDRMIERPRVVYGNTNETPRPHNHNPKQDPSHGVEYNGNFDSFVKPQKPRIRSKGRDGNHEGRFPDYREPGIKTKVEEDDDIIEETDDSKCDCYNDPRWIRQREREERKRKKILSKIRKKQKYMKRIEDPEIRKQAETCGTEEKMNCFWHDKDHWKTAPFWDDSAFCFCMNSNNNTYSCLRSVNSTHNYLYCQFITGFKMYFDLRQDPYQLKNGIGTLPATDEDWMLVQLLRLKKCKGREECWADQNINEEAIQSSIWEQIFGRWPKKKKRGNRRRNNS